MATAVSKSSPSSLIYHNRQHAGIAFGSPNRLFLECSQTQLTTFGFAASYITDVATGSIIANTSDVSSSDQVTCSTSTGWFYSAAFQEMFATGTANPNLGGGGSKWDAVRRRVAGGSWLSMVWRFLWRVVCGLCCCREERNGKERIPRRLMEKI
jgi:hypothetical protein